MSELISRYYQYAQLAQAAYGDLPIGTPAVSILTGNQVELSQRSAEEFSRRYQVLHRETIEGLNGFSATLFFDTGTGQKILAIRGTEFTVGDLATDTLIGVFGTSVLNPQYQALKNYVERLYMPVSPGSPGLGLLGGNEQFSIAGHSLGGYLGSMLTADSNFGRKKGDRLLFWRSTGAPTRA